MTTRKRLIETISVRLKDKEREVFDQHATDLDISLSRLGRRYFLEGLARDGVVIEA